MNAKADRLKALVMCYWRFTKSCPMVAYEASNADVMAINPSGKIIETEVKTSIADLRRDIKKGKHYRLTHPERFPGALYIPECHYFYFATAPELCEQALPIIRELYPYAGYLVVRDVKVIDYYHRDITAYSPNVVVAKKAMRIKRPKMGKSEFLRLVKAQSGKLCCLSLEATAGKRLFSAGCGGDS